MIRVGIGGWTFEPWRGGFFPEGLAHARELEYASRKVTTIEVNGTFYRTQTRDSFKRWADETPDDFVFSLKAVRYAVNRRVLAEAGASIDTFLNSGVGELKHKLGPILWQFAATKTFDAKDFGAFLALLPASVDGVKLRHAVEPRHESFRCPEFVALAREHKAAIVFADSDDYPAIADQTSDFVYARLQRTSETAASGYRPAEIKSWAAHAHAWEKGEQPKGLAYVGEDKTAKARPAKRDVFIYMIAGAKERNPAAAMALLKAL